MVTKPKAEPEETPDEESAVEEKLSAACSNCGEPSVMTTDGITANEVSYCAQCLPDNLSA